MTKQRWILPLALAALIPVSCTRAPLQRREDALKRVRPPELVETAPDLTRASLESALRAQIAWFHAPAQAQLPALAFGERQIAPADYVRMLEQVLALSQQNPGPEFYAQLRESFDVYAVYGDKGEGQIFTTSYYEPRMRGSLTRTAALSQALYSAPLDLIPLDLTPFDPKFSVERKLRARLQGGRIVPYYTRQEIDSEGKLRGRGLELAWVDPIDAFFLQVQGSGTVELPDGRGLRLNYAEKNGQPYQSLGQALKKIIQANPAVTEVNLQVLEAYLRTLPPDELQKTLNLNPSYVFFRGSFGQAAESAITSIGLPASDGRTIATDPKFFPKGAIAFYTFERPVFDSPTALVPARTQTESRLVLDQDIGGAITGGGRVDLFWGRGDEAKRMAGAVQSRGTLYYLAPKERPEASTRAPIGAPNYKARPS